MVTLMFSELVWKKKHFDMIGHLQIVAQSQIHLKLLTNTPVTTSMQERDFQKVLHLYY